jgi:hypothetical protein
VGIGGTTVPNQTSGEIDPLESIVATFAAPSRIDYFFLSFLYDGTEFNDFQEVATITANGGPTGQLRATFSVAGDQAQWSGTGFGSYTNISPALGNRSGVWRVDNPFGDALVTGLTFGALNGTCGTQCCGAQCCSDQSDYPLERIAFTPVPEPGTLLLVVAGLAGLVARGRRRN